MAAKTLLFTTAAPPPRPAFNFNQNATGSPKLPSSPDALASPTTTEEDAVSWSSRFSHNSRASDDSDEKTPSLPPLPTEAEALKQQLRRKWPRPLFRFSLRAMRRVVVSPVPIPIEFADPRARVATVSGAHIPLTRQMHLRQKNAFVRRRLPDTVDEYVVY